MTGKKPPLKHVGKVETYSHHILQSPNSAIQSEENPQPFSWKSKGLDSISSILNFELFKMDRLPKHLVLKANSVYVHNIYKIIANRSAIISLVT